MYVLKGFINVDALANNIPGNVSLLGELSNISASYAIEKGYYQKNGIPNVQLVSFSSNYNSGPRITVPAKYTDHVLTVTQWMFQYALENKFNDDSTACRSLILQMYGSVIKNLTLGEMVYAKGSWLPSYMSWEFEGAGEDNTLRVWFADEAFKAQYDEYQIVIIPPLEPVDIFQRIKSDVSASLSTFTVPELHQKVLAKTGGEPYTYLVSNDYDWFDREDPNATLRTTWTVAIYGTAGNNVEVIKDAIGDYILEHSATNKDGWINVFPDIFTNTEFTIIPMWNKRSVPDESVRGSLYSPIVSYDGLLALVKRFVTYPSDHTDMQLQIGTAPYKSLSFMAVGSQENRDSKYKLTDFYPDFANISTSSIDFNRMNSYTTEFILKFVEAIIAAEEMNEYSYVGATLSRIKRGKLLYVGFSHGNLSFLVLSRLSLSAALVVAV